MFRSNSPILSSDALSSQLSGSLPVYVSATDVEKHPKLSHLLEDLTHRITPTGMTKATHTHLTYANHAMKHARQNFLEVATLHRLVQDVVYEMPAENTVEDKSLRALGEALTLSELQDHIILVSHGLTDEEHGTGKDDPQETQYVFGITPELILARATTTLSKKQLSCLANALEQRLEQEWVRIASFHDPVGYLNYNPDEVATLPESVDNTRRKVTSEWSKLVHSIKQTDFLFQQVYSLLLEYGGVLKSLMAKQRLFHFPMHQLHSRSVSLATQLLKLRCIGLEIMVDTYTSQSVPALRVIHSHLKDRRADAERNLARLQHEFQSYSGLDLRFQELLREYAKLQQDIQFCKLSE